MYRCWKCRQESHAQGGRPICCFCGAKARVRPAALQSDGYCEHCPRLGGYCCVCGGGPIIVEAAK